MRTYTGVVPAPEDGMGLPTIGVPPGGLVDLDLRLESVTEGVYVSGTAHARLEGECARCLDPFTDEITDEDELPRVVDDHVDVEQTVRDALVLDLPLAPLCRPDCRGLCAECGEKWADLAPDHGHETLDPRWAALRERLPAE